MSNDYLSILHECGLKLLGHPTLGIHKSLRESNPPNPRSPLRAHSW